MKIDLIPSTYHQLEFRVTDGGILPKAGFSYSVIVIVVWDGCLSQLRVATFRLFMNVNCTIL